MVEDELKSIDRIERTRRVNEAAARKCFEQGVTAEELAIAWLYSAYQAAAAHAGPAMGAIEWLRSGVDTIERQIMRETSTSAPR